MSNVDLKQYEKFVGAVTSDASNNLDSFLNRLDTLNKVHDIKVNIPLLITACIGLAAEAGEFVEVPKKIIFQGKPLDEAALFHMKRELGDVMWYWINACNALRLDPNEVIAENVRKLEARYPGGHFDAFYSENRKEGDL